MTTFSENIPSSLSTKKILVTGGAGFIGSHITETLLRTGAFVRVVDNLSTGNKKNISSFEQKYPAQFEFVWGDITQLDTCRNVVTGIDIVCHQAALGSVPRSVIDPISSHRNNVDGFLNVLVAAKDAGIKRFVYASSSSVYGDNNVLPKIEENTGNVLSPYAATKAVDEIYAGVFTKCYGMECIGLRYFNIFGPRQDPNGQYAAVIPKFIDMIQRGEVPTINGDGTFSRDFTHVSNAVLANCLAMSATDVTFGCAINIGAGGRTTILDLFNEIKMCLGTECADVDMIPIFGPNRAGDIPHSNACVTKAHNIIGYEPITLFADGIKNTVEYFKK